MKRYTANYAFTNPNFVVQNLVEAKTELPEKPLLYVLKNILQRGFPTLMSRHLQSLIGAVQDEKDFRSPFLLVGAEPARWTNTIKGDEQNQYFPAKEFLETLIPEYFGEYAFVQSLMLPEAEINEITGEYNARFAHQCVDFYLPQAKMVVEIDGQQHKTDDVTRVNDAQRDNYLVSKGITTFRISTLELRNGQFEDKIDLILQHLERYQRNLSFYKEAYEKFSQGAVTAREIQTKLIPTAIIRFQILLIELLLNNYLNLKEAWRFNLIVQKEEQLGDFAELAIGDFFIWFSQLYRLKEKKDWLSPDYSVNYSFSRSGFDSRSGVINIDFSLLNRWTDVHAQHPDLLFVRTDYFGAEKNYFEVSCTAPINYRITNDDLPALEFFLHNIFGNKHFREGQFPIIANVLNREDTIGLLPTGGGKSLCYQLPCLLQPSINFVVCPIKSLMYDQHQNMKHAYITNTNFITSDLISEAKTKVQEEFAERKYLFVWISPERFQIKDFREYLSRINAHSPIAHAVIDEVHCLSEWGHDFRTSYLNLAKTIERYCPQAQFIGLTATASVNVLKDIKAEFARNRRVMRDENIKSLLDYSRKELVFNVIKDNNNKFALLRDIIKEEGILEQSDKGALVFTPHVNGEYGCFSVANRLSTGGQGRVKWYSGEVPKVPEFNDNGIPTGRKIPVMEGKQFNKYKQDVQVEYKKSAFPVMVATKAFGMGIDKKNIHYTFHYGLPSSIEALYQEAGRAGRWDKRLPENQDIKALCYVLYSPETTEGTTVDRLFEQDTTFSEIKAINEEVGREGRDVFRQVFLFLQGHHDIAEEFKSVKLILDNYFRPASKQFIYYETIAKELRGIGFAAGNDQLTQVAQKAIYRLSLLGIVNDWTTNFINHYEVEFISVDDQHVFDALEHFITKYKPEIDLEQELRNDNRPTHLDNCIWFLLKWSFENIAYSRKQTLKTLAEWCDEFEIIGNEAFKARIDNYFRFTETTFIFQHITEHPEDIEKWFEVFYRIDRDMDSETRIYIPAIEDELIRKSEFERLRDSLSRFLESYRNNTGLDLISGIVRLFLDDFEDTDGRNRFESALTSPPFEKARRTILDRIIEIGDYAHEESKATLCLSIAGKYPDELETLADRFGLYYLLNDSISQKLQLLKLLNKKLYGEIEQIGTV